MLSISVSCKSLVSFSEQDIAKKKKRIGNKLFFNLFIIIKTCVDCAKIINYSHITKLSIKNLLIKYLQYSTIKKERVSCIF